MPLLLDANDDENDAECDNDAANDGHAPVDASPPLDAVMVAVRVDVLHLMAGLHPNVQMACAKVSLCHVALRLGRDWQNGAYHPRWILCQLLLLVVHPDVLTKWTDKAKDKEHKLDVSSPESEFTRFSQ